MNAIETAYGGCRFRSRLEARWAVFFDALGIRWDYEPEGFETPAGRYLPDFFLRYSAGAPILAKYPGAGTWIEIKPIPPTPAEVEKLRAVCIGTNHVGQIIAGTPWEYQSQSISRTGQIEHPRYRAERDWIAFESATDGPHAAQFAANEARGARFEHGYTPASIDPPEGIRALQEVSLLRALTSPEKLSLLTLLRSRA